MRALRRHRVDLLLIALCMLVGAVLGRSALRAEARAGVPPAFYQRWFGAAVLDACGLGYREPPPDRVPPALADFLAIKVDRFSCADLPADTPLEPANWYAQMHRYLGGSLTTLWRVRGIRWSAISLLFTTFSGLTVAAIYGLFRLGMNRWWSIAGAFAIAASGLNLFYVHLLRDYSKAPFMIAGLIVFGHMVSRPYGARRLLTLSALAGAILGVGFGFRTDVVVAIPMFLIVLTALLPAPLRSTLGTRALAAVAFFAIFTITAWPILRAYGNGSNTAHVTLLGLSDGFAAALGLEPTHYWVNMLYADRPIEVAVRAHAQALDGGSGWTTLSSNTYDRMSRRYLRVVAGLLPADMLVQGYAAIRRILESPFDVPGQERCARLAPSLAGTVCVARHTVLSPLRPFAIASVALLLIVVCAIHWRVGVFLIATLAIFAGSLTLQYDPRHAFYLEALSLWAMAFLLQHSPRLPGLWRTMRQRGPADGAIRAAAFRAAAVTLTLLVVPLAALTAARAYQQRALSALFASYTAAAVDPLPGPLPMNGGPSVAAAIDTLLPPIDPNTPDEMAVHVAFLRAELGGPSCPAGILSFDIYHQITLPGYVGPLNSVLPIETKAGSGPQLVFFPIYRALIGAPGGAAPVGDFRFLGLNLPPERTACVQSLSVVREPRRFPVKLLVSLTPDWRLQRHYRVMAASPPRVPR